MTKVGPLHWSPAAWSTESHSRQPDTDTMDALKKIYGSVQQSSDLALGGAYKMGPGPWP